jgi:hypothetical protein
MPVVQPASHSSNAPPVEQHLGTKVPVSNRVETTFVDPLRDPEWDRLVELHPDYTFFHTSAWARVLHKSYGHEPVYLRCRRGGDLLALLPLMDVRSPLTGSRGVCLPFTDFCGPLIFGEDGSVALIHGLSELARERKWKYFEIRDRKVLEASTKPAVAFYGHTLDLRGTEEDRFARVKSSVRRALRKAERSDLSVQSSQTREAVLDYYRLHVQTRRRHGTPPQPLSFFLNIYEEVIKAGGLGFVVTAYVASRPIAAAVFVYFGKKGVYKFGASDEKAMELRGNNLVMWEGIRSLAERGVESLHFGRTSLSNDGLRRFKQTWGTREETIEYLRFETTTGTWASAPDAASGFHTAVFSRLPLAINRLAGTLIYPHLD